MQAFPGNEESLLKDGQFIKWTPWIHFSILDFDGQVYHNRILVKNKQ